MRKPATKPRTTCGDHKPPKDVQRILNEQNYAHLGQLGTRGWVDELRRLYELSTNNNLGLHQDDAKVAGLNIAGRTRVFLPGAPVVQLIPPTNDPVLVPKHLLPALVVNINAPDDIVRTEFEAALAEARGQFPAAFTKPGPRAMNGEFYTRVFLSWCNARIVQLAELLAWNEARRARRLPPYPEHVLGEWIGLVD